MKTKNDTASKIRALREKSKLNRKQFGSLVGCAESTVWRWEAGEREPPSAIMQLLEIKLGGTNEEAL